MSEHPSSGARPTPLDASVARRMSRQPRRDTAPEVALRRELHRRGMRFRVDWPLPGLPRRRADIAFTRRRIVVFVDGCFWHACPEHRTAPASNADWWAAKLQKNLSRDRNTDKHMRLLGWTVLRFWEHEDPVSAAECVEAAVRGATSAGPAPPPVPADG
jgi:DNA mismatch endonuclease (patch repair protein)